MTRRTHSGRLESSKILFIYLFILVTPDISSPLLRWFALYWTRVTQFIPYSIFYPYNHKILVSKFLLKLFLFPVTVNRVYRNINRSCDCTLLALMYMYLRRKYVFADGQDSLKVVTKYVSETFYFCSEMSRLTAWEDLICREMLKKVWHTQETCHTRYYFCSKCNGNHVGLVPIFIPHIFSVLQYHFFTSFRILLKWESRECCGRTAYSDQAVRYEVELWSWCDKRRSCRRPWIDIIFKMKNLIQSCGGSSAPELPIRCAHHWVTLSG